MDSKYNHEQFEQDIYKRWESDGVFNPDTQKNIDSSKEPFSIILPPPNANDPLHAGHALFVVQDILIRYKKLQGHKVLWLPGTDHAGIETQFVFEKKLKEKGQSRFDFDRETLYKMIFDYVKENGQIAVEQLKRLGYMCDWSRLRFTLDPDHITRIYAVFNKLHADNLLYRDEKIVNYCTHCGTGFSNLEIDYKTVEGKLWTINYGPLQVATTRPETMLGDTAVAVHPDDARYQSLIGTKIKLPLTSREIPIIGDTEIDPAFGTGAVKVTPSHSPVDYDIAKRHNLEFIRIFNYDGKSNQNVPSSYQDLFPKQLRNKVLEDLTSQLLLISEKPHTHEVGHCYRCGNIIEPITSAQWFIKMDTLAKEAKKVVDDGQIKFFPDRFKETYDEWMANIRDWPISRQIVWGHRIPVWYNLDETPTIRINFINNKKETINDTWQNLKDKYSLLEISSGLQNLLAPKEATYYLSPELATKHSVNILQETDTFDTWFSSGQWAYSTLGWDAAGNHSPDFKTFYPSSVMDTMWDILFFWVARMIMLSVYATGQIPFKTVHLHSRVVDKFGKKMSKSKGNVIEPIAVANTYGADALRLALVIGVAPASDISLSDDKIRSQRNFVNKLWNASRFIKLSLEKYQTYPQEINMQNLNSEDKEILQKTDDIIKNTEKYLNQYHFGQASSDLYQFFWHDFCDVYIESVKTRDANVAPVLLHVLKTSLLLLHPFIPFVTEAVYTEMFSPTDLLINQQWPKLSSV